MAPARLELACPEGERFTGSLGCLTVNDAMAGSGLRCTAREYVCGPPPNGATMGDSIRKKRTIGLELMFGRLAFYH